MRKISLLLFSLPFIFASSAYAESRASVKINNNVSSNSESTVNSTTNIRIETNGKVTEYHSDKAENVEINAVNDTSEIKVNGQVVSQSPTSASTSPTQKPTETPQPTDKDEKEKEIEEQKENLLDIINNFIEKIFSIF